MKLPMMTMRGLAAVAAVAAAAALLLARGALGFSAPSQRRTRFVGVAPRLAARGAGGGAEPWDSSQVSRAVAAHTNLAAAAEDYAPALAALLAREAHTSHKDWPATQRAAQELAAVVGGPGDATFDRVFRRVLEGGGWDQAVQAARRRQGKPWAVLVTGLNGIRKTYACLPLSVLLVLLVALAVPACATAAAATAAAPNPIPLSSPSGHQPQHFLVRALVPGRAA